MKLSSELDAIVEGIISYLTEKKSLDLLPEIARQLSMQSYFRTDPNQALVYSKIALSTPQKHSISKVLTDHLKRPIKVKNKLDKSIVAGFKVEVAGQVIDATVNRRLKDLKLKVLYD